MVVLVEDLPLSNPGGGGGGSGSEQFNGLWSNTSGTLVLQGSSTQFTFHTANTTKWSEALQKGYISIGSPYLRNFVSLGNNTWSCEALWNESTASQGVIGVKWVSDSKVELRNNGQELYITSTKDGEFTSGSLYKQ
jgi:hypothetical protein